MRKLFANGHVWHSREGVASRTDVLVEDGVIGEVGTDGDADQVVDCTGALLLPGFIDCHSHVALSFEDVMEAPRGFRHLRAVATLRTLLDLGVTTVRDAWGADAALREAVARGWVAGPRLLVSLRQLSTTGGIGDHWSPSLGGVELFDDPSMPNSVFDGPDQARAAARRMLQAGADWLKLASTGSIMGPNALHQEVTDEETVALVEEADRRGGRHVMAHAHGARAAEAAARAGVRSIEHGIHLDEAAVAVMAERGTWLVPTLSVTMGEATPDAELVQAHQASVRMALDAGVPIAMGTDCPMSPYAETLKEIGYLAVAGLGAAGAVRAATYDAGRLLDLDVGEIRLGKQADLVLLTAEPGEDPLGDVSDLLTGLGGLEGRPAGFTGRTAAAWLAELTVPASVEPPEFGLGPAARRAWPSCRRAGLRPPG